MWSVSTKTRLHQVKPGWYNVLDFGLRNDGSTDNKNALQNLINTVGAAGGGTLYFPPGTYYISDSISLSYPIRLQGAGRNLTTITAGTYNRFFDISTSNISISDLNLSAITLSLGSPGDIRYAGTILFQNLKLTGAVYYEYIRLYARNLSATGETGIRVQNVTFYIPSSAPKTAIKAESQEVPICISNCAIHYEAFSGSVDVIIAGGYGIRIEDIYLRAFAGNVNLVNVIGGKVYIDGIRYYVMYDTKRLVYVGSSEASVILGDYSGSASMCSFIVADGYKENVTYLEELRFSSANPAGATGLWLPTDRSTGSTSYVTLKSFRTNFSGEFKLRIEGANNDPNNECYVRVLKNGNVVREWAVTPDAGFTLEQDISVVRTDLIEIQAKAAREQYPIVIQDVTGRQIEYQSTLYYALND